LIVSQCGVCDGAAVDDVAAMDGSCVDAEFAGGDVIDVEHADRTIAVATTAVVRRFRVPAYRQGVERPQR
jgi:hypothetical protein